MIEHALALARRGFRIFPVWWPIVRGDGSVACACPEPECRLGGQRERDVAKHPVTFSGLNDSTSDEHQVRAWWAEYPQANIGLDLAGSGLCALDVDSPQGREAAVAKLHAAVAATGELPPTVEVVSGSGWHLYYRRPAGVELRGDYMGLTVRGRNYVVTPPSMHRLGRRYAWEDGAGIEDVEVAELPPSWLAALARPERDLSDAGAPAGEPAWLAAIPAADRVRRAREHLLAEPGQRRGVDPDSVGWGVCRTTVRGYALGDLDAAADLLVECWAPRCDPPYAESKIREFAWNALNQAHTPAWGASLEREALGERLALEAAARSRPAPDVRERAQGAAGERLRAALDAAISGRAQDADSRERRERLRDLRQAAPQADDGRVARIVRDVVGVAVECGVTDEDVVVTACLPLGDHELVRELVRGLMAASAASPVAEPEPEDDEELRAVLAKDEEGVVQANSDNLLMILRFSEDLRGRVQFDEVTKATSVAAPTIRAAVGTEVAAVRAHVCRRWGASYRSSDVQEYLGHVAKTYGSRDPLADYLSSLTWDGVRRVGSTGRWSHREREGEYRDDGPRVAGWLVDYCHASTVDLGGEDVADYVADVGAKWLISAAARGLSPGCKVDTVLVIEGGQGRKKSGVIDVLGGEWFYDGKLDLGGDKDAMQVIQSVWMVELAELASLARSATADQKAFLSRRKDFFRAPYDRVPLWWSRRCVFAGTVNPEVDGSVDYNADRSGARRWWAARVQGVADLGRLRDDRDQLLAEAVYRYRRGERWWLTPSEQEVADRVMGHRQAQDAWAPILMDWARLAVAGKAGLVGGAASDRWKLADIARGALGIEPRELYRNMRAVTTALRVAGFREAPRSRVRYWLHPELSVPDAPPAEDRQN